MDCDLSCTGKDGLISMPVYVLAIFAAAGALMSLMHPTMPLWFGVAGGLAVAILLALIAAVVMSGASLLARFRPGK